MKPLCYLETPFDEKFGAPRQALLVLEAWGRMAFKKTDFYTEAFRGIENFSHLWLIFEFHLVIEENIKSLVRPPRFGGKEKWGVFATRSPHRPNRLGLSVVKFDRLEITSDEVIVWVRGVDLVSGTPIFDIKPYLPYSDSLPSARATNFEGPPAVRPVMWKCDKPQQWELIEKVIALDPRPAHDREETQEFGVSLAGQNVRFKLEGDAFLILSVVELKI
jgi:tRNA (adenine37-N6)-methyltransferase